MDPLGRPLSMPQSGGVAALPSVWCWHWREALTGKASYSGLPDLGPVSQH
jgi:hypothetical protein